MLRKQTPTAPNEWLYQSSMETRTKEVTNDDGTIETLTEEVEVRQFVRSAYLGNNADPWQECTDAEKEAWEAMQAEREVEPNGDMGVEPLDLEVLPNDGVTDVDA